MKIKYSALVSGVSGKLNGSVGATNRGGAYLRNKGVVTNPQTVSQQANRSLFGSISSQFRSLTPAQIAAWNAASANFPYTDRFGDVRFLSGSSLYVQLNKNLIQAGLPSISDAPAKQSFPAITGVVLSINIASGGTPALNAEIQTDAVNLADFRAEVKLTPSVSPSVSYVKNLYRLIGYGGPEPADDAIAYEDYAAYTSVFGTPIAGQRVYGEISLISTISGERSAPFPVSAIVQDSV